MNVSAWPFLVSRNRSLDYRTIVAPDFIVDANIAASLAKLVGGQPSVNPKYHDISDTKVGNITLLYRVVNAAEGKKVFEDGFGRPILWIEGIVLKGVRKDVAKPDEVLQEAHNRVKSPFLEFWDQTMDASIKRSEAFDLWVKDGQSLPYDWRVAAVIAFLLGILITYLFLSLREENEALKTENKELKQAVEKSQQENKSLKQ
jgi:hypothetical protein